MKNNKWKIVFIGAIIIGGFVSLLASTFPDGLEKIAEEQGFLENGKQLISGLMPDYQVPGIYIENIAKSFAGMVGTCMVFVILLLAGKFLFRFKKD
ncbi:MAG: hypothetical protein HGA37_16030 [Lentimicrobium sp.]|nr:hypothetical protein [Lentimicrobium sp.]